MYVCITCVCVCFEAVLGYEMQYRLVHTHRRSGLFLRGQTILIYWDRNFGIRNCKYVTEYNPYC